MINKPHPDPRPPTPSSPQRALYAQYLRVLLRKALITPDDFENWQQICPLFEPVYVFYDEGKEFYQELADVQREILAG